ncbi:MAG: PAS domain-containing protein, partial [Deltaproteobacteria bacterium]|nr:PAS domain-containing protein [Deltaproteobacteria bacterium]
NAREGIIVSQKGRVVFANERAVTLSGFTLDELGDYSLAELIFPDDLEEALDRYRRVLKGENLEGDLEYRIVDRRGKIRRSVRISR